MVARRSASWDDAAGVAAQAEALRRRLERLASGNAAAYAAATTTLEGRHTIDPRDRDRRIKDALQDAVIVLLAIGEASVDVACVAALTATHGDARVQADAVVAASASCAATRATAHLVSVNLGTAEGDPRLREARRFAEQAASHAGRAERLSQ